MRCVLFCILFIHKLLRNALSMHIQFDYIYFNVLYFPFEFFWTRLGVGFNELKKFLSVNFLMISQ